MDQLANFVAFSPLAPQIADGEKSLQQSLGAPRRLNPIFAEWLMGWPLQWTKAKPHAYGALVTASWHSKLQWQLSCLLEDPESLDISMDDKP